MIRQFIRLFILAALAYPAWAQTTRTLAAGQLGVSCNAVTVATTNNPGTAGGCTAFNLLTSGGTLPNIYTWSVVTTGSPAGLSVILMGSLDGVNWTALQSATTATTQTTSTAAAYRWLGCIPSAFTGGTVTCQISVTAVSGGGGTGAGVSSINGTAGAFTFNPGSVCSGTTCTFGAGSGTVNSGTAGFFTWYPSGGTTVGSNAHLDDGITNAGAITATEPIYGPALNYSGTVTTVTGSTGQFGWASGGYPALNFPGSGGVLHIIPIPQTNGTYVSSPVINFSGTVANPPVCTPAAPTNGRCISFQNTGGGNTSAAIVGDGVVTDCLSGTGTYVPCAGALLVSTAAIVGAAPVKADTANANQVVVTTTTDTNDEKAIGVCVNSPAAGGTCQVITSGIAALTLGTGTCAIGQFVGVDSTTNGRILCTSTYNSGNIIGMAMAAQATVGSTVNVMVGIR